MNREAKRNTNDKSGKDYNLNKQMNINDCKKWTDDINKDWPSTDRINKIGRDHNDGEIYAVLEEYK